MTPRENESWDRYQKLVLSQLAHNATCIEDLSKTVDKLSIDVGKLSEYSKGMETVKKELATISEFTKTTNREIGELQVKSGVWGALFGMITSATMWFTKN